MMLAALVEGELVLQEMHRFSNGPIEEQGSLRWDFQKIFSEVKTGIKKAAASKANIRSIGIDTWGVDFGLIDKDGNLLENPYHYRDSRTEGIPKEAFKIVPKRDIYFKTGIQFLPFNTLYQLLAYQKQKPQLLSRVSKLLFMSDLFVYFLTGAIGAEYTMASTSQMLDMKTGKWSQKLLNAFELPKDILPKIIQPGTKLGVLKKHLAEEFGCSQIPVVAVGSHDTASAVAAVPAVKGENWAYLSSGTWSLLGVETAQPIVNDDSFKMEFTNEGGVEGKIRLLKNIMGLWLVQQCRRQWLKEGVEFEYSQLTKLARKAEPFHAFIDTEYFDFLSPGDMPAKIDAYLKKTSQEKINDTGQMIRVILESLAARYSQVLKMLEELIRNTIDVLHIVGGGSQNDLLNQLTANSTDRKVVTGPVEAAVIGNVLMQALAAGDVSSLSEARSIIANSFVLKEYVPKNFSEWKEYIRRTENITSALE